MLLVAGGIAAVFALFHEASKPYVYRWWMGEKEAKVQQARARDLQTPDTENDLAVDWKVAPSRLRTLDDSAQPSGIDAELDRHWQTVIGELSSQNRFALLQALIVATAERPVDSAGAIGTIDRPTLDALRAAWERRHAELFDRSAGIPEEKAAAASRQSALTIRSRVDRQLAALGEPIDEQSPTGVPADSETATPERSSEDLAPILRAWDRAALDAVEDATAIGDPREHDLWYRLLQRLANVSEEDLLASATASVTETALARQPEVHRGELIAIKGTARGGKSVIAEENPLGIRRYYVIWVQPDDDRDKLIAVYSLSRPRGFPKLPEQSEVVRFAYRVEVPAYFVKKLAYGSKEAVSVSPLAVARSFRFTPKETSAPVLPPTTTTYVAGLAAAASIAACVTAFVYFRTRRDPRMREEAPERIDVEALKARVS